MLISTLITVGSGRFAGDAAWAAQQVLAALGGNPADDQSSARVENVSLQFTVNVNLEDGDAFHYTADAAATQVLAALGGNPTTDYCTVTVTENASGESGKPPA